ncbi:MULTISPECIES: type III-B CRISPR-associated protein Cas10/Cmr2 [Clostridia]|uniref:type III-B CRISPR-associated protein Cas10/Cmr2 n=1 Tax=Clostridia TaxID=186801 RepID=UPI000EA2C341|nr:MULTISPECIES: type III-B CRISPR-associated protein Cas10/Cmr2 [Clostridia]NBJ68373.1 type III-B CRISPR-associated protein Cas10/Cmr2 [Roseburia sp. 1XD42-34]RKI81461.1 type III-B CRISPR-associated protein Cas10/Cmr2 [Clostridium sp. 1xD42-85]
MRESLLLFTIGPVKHFIEPSRKLKDLYAGSFLLSHLARVAAKHLKDLGAEIIIPSPNQASSPNRIVAKVGSDCDQSKLVNSTEQTVHECFMKICKKVIERENTFTEEVEDQLTGFLEINWVYEPIESDFKTSYQALMKHMHSVKNTRMFVQSFESAGRKCDLYEQYNALFTSKKAPKEELQQAKLKKGENLSAIAYVKRFLDTYFAEQDHYNLDVSSVAYMLLRSYFPPEVDLTDVKDEGSEALFDLKNGEDITNHPDYSTKTIKRATELYKSYGEYIGSPYYAIVKLDGDGVGQKYKAVDRSEIAQSLSDEISRFAIDAKQLIEKNKGLCIFAGGEDILAFLPLQTLFPTLKELVNRFADIEGLDYKGTLSAGIIIAHYTAPLKPLLQQVERLESHAKQIDRDKAAFSMEIMRRGGLSTPLRMKFGQKAENLNIFENTLVAIQQQEHSNSFIQNVVAMIEPIQYTASREMVSALIRKILKNSVEKEKVEEQLNVFNELYEALSFHTEKFIRFLQQLAFLAKETFIEKEGKGQI